MKDSGLPYYLRAVEHLISLLLGTFVATLGLTLPGMVNMTAVSVSLKHGKGAGMQFTGGAAAATSIQASLAIFFAEYLRKNPSTVTLMQKSAVYIFVILAIGFFYKAYTGQVAKPRKKRSKRKNLGFGFGLAMANGLAIPFFLAVSSWLISHGHRVLGVLDIALFSIGAAFGATIVFAGYVRSAGWVSRHAAWLTRNINYVMSGFFLFLAVFQGWNIYC